MDKQEVIDYLMYTPYNTNLAVLKSMLGDGDWSELLDYVKRASYRINRRVLEGILSADDGIVLLEGTYEFVSWDESFATYIFNTDKCYDPAIVTVTVDGVTATLPRVIPQETVYGEEDDGGDPAFTTYPAYIVIENAPEGGTFMVSVATAGSHTIKITTPSDSEIDDGGEDEDDGAIYV